MDGVAGAGDNMTSRWLAMFSGATKVIRSYDGHDITLISPAQRAYLISIL